MSTTDPVVGARKAAFTLVELLVVIAIIGILAGLLVPTVMDAMSKAYQVNCQKNLKQIATAVINYTSEYRGGIPPTYVEDTGLYWCNLLAKRGLPSANTAELADDEMTGANTVLLCPSSTSLRVKQGDRIPTPDDPRAQGWYRLGNEEFATDCSYYWNGYVGDSAEFRERFPSLSVNYSNPQEITIHDISEIAQRSATAMVMDGVFFQEGRLLPQRIAARHTGTAGQYRLTNIAFYDTHVEALDRDPRTEQGEIDWEQESNVGENLDLVPIMVREPDLTDGPPWFMLPKR
jgi:prepilin-type N-terminal cleavage/methylation domain-containing protein